MTLKQTPSQTVGPFFAFGLTAQQYHYPLSQLATGMMRPDTPIAGTPIRILGRVFDGNDQPIDDAMIELWQPNAAGRFNHPNDARDDRLLEPEFLGYGRCGTGTHAAHQFLFDTIKPGAISSQQAPFVTVVVFMRGLPNHAYTRLYFSDDRALQQHDPVLQSVPAERQHTLIAQRHESPAGLEYHFDIHMQGPQETVFFDL